MNGEPPPAPSTAAPPPATGVAGTRHFRPWTPAAAMEPVPPLAPPPARPGAGTPVITSARTPARGASLRTVMGLAAVALVIAALVFALLALGH